MPLIRQWLLIPNVNRKPANGVIPILALLAANDARHVIPLTSNVSRIYPGEAVVTVNGAKNKAMIDQIMSADKSRLKNKITQLLEDDILSIEAAMKRFFAIK